MKALFKLPLTILVLLAGACTDLDLEPQSNTTSSTLFKDESAYRAFLAKIYSGFAVTGQQGPAGNSDITSLDEGFSNYLRQWWQLEELSTDEAVIGWGDEGIQDLHNHNWTTANQFNRAIYYRIFFQVSQANEFLRETTDAKLTERNVSQTTRSDVKTYRAEARFMRALSLWHGIDLFGNIPFYTEDTPISSEPPEQFNRSDVFDFIDRELQAIENDMVAPGQNEYGRADRAALWMLQAKLYLNAEVYAGSNRYTDCVAACKKVIDSGVYSLQDNYRELFMADNNLSPEVIFAIPFDGLNTQTWGGTTYLVHAALGGKMVDNMNDLTGAELKDEAAKVYGVNSGWFGLRTTSAIVDLFPDVSGVTDERAIFYIDGQSKEIGENGIGNFNEGFAVPKYTNLTSLGDPGSDLTHTDTDFPMFRLADAYLMYAEAVLRGGSGGDAGTAVNYINALRQRAYNNDSGNITANDLTLDFILDERARELYWEGHRRTDLVRFNLFTENGIWPHKGGVPEGKTTDPYRNLYPIPAGEILANPKLQQNPGYF
ncbi:MAG: RagB/SusD family nutrient uptake outer membrane protein [Haliscomenobacteraceae bacterium CHB4]|nr:Starch-binding protein SusD [Saprospiraceae bacterium]MCE7925785.1 RagB/SusD family nutrient uptake outer membrane protein [Haliscomenobacteraceae bacterium CHB4]